MDNPLEDVEHLAFAKYLNGKDIFFHHSPNGGKRDPIVGRKLRLMGTKPGWPDFEFPQWNIYIEIKRRKNGKRSPEQIKIHEELEKCGRKVFTCKGCDESIQVIEGFLKEFFPF